MIALKTEAELRVVAENAQLLAEILVEVALHVEPDVETAELDRLAEERIRAAGARPAFKGYHGYPASLCVSVNEEIVHGIPSSRRINRGDIVSLDLGLTRGVRGGRGADRGRGGDHARGGATAFRDPRCLAGCDSSR